MKRSHSFFLALAFFLVPALPAFADSAMPAPAPCPAFTRDLSEGMSDTATVKDVSALQERLIGAGYLKASISGTFGPKTLAAVQTLQRANGLNAQGFVGPLTRARLQALGCGAVASSDTELSFVVLDTPDELTRGNAGTWILQFSPRTIAPRTLSFDVAWGDESTSTGAIVTTAGSATTTLAFFAHTYEKIGAYRITMHVTPPQGESLFIQTTAHVGR